MGAHNEEIQAIKREVIRRAYVALGFNWDAINSFVNEDGWCLAYILIANNNANPKDYRITQFKGDATPSWRPISLDNIENNNGWIHIDGLEDLPTDDNMTYFAASDDYIYGKFFTKDSLRDEYLRFGLTHYQPIVFPKPRIF